MCQYFHPPQPKPRMPSSAYNPLLQLHHSLSYVNTRTINCESKYAIRVWLLHAVDSRRSEYYSVAAFLHVSFFPHKSVTKRKQSQICTLLPLCIPHHHLSTTCALVTGKWKSWLSRGDVEPCIRNTVPLLSPQLKLCFCTPLPHSLTSRIYSILNSRNSLLPFVLILLAVWWELNLLHSCVRSCCKRISWEMY